MVQYETLNLVFDWSCASVRKVMNLCNRFLDYVVKIERHKCWCLQQWLYASFRRKKIILLLN